MCYFFACLRPVACVLFFVCLRPVACVLFFCFSFYYSQMCSNLMCNSYKCIKTLSNNVLNILIILQCTHT